MRTKCVRNFFRPKWGFIKSIPGVDHLDEGAGAVQHWRGDRKEAEKSDRKQRHDPGFPDLEVGRRGPFLTSPLGANFDPKGKVVFQR
jgi:hypothetical protein